jgi:guanylate kinase
MAQFIVLSAPSGAGKTTIAKLLSEKHEDYTISISATTRNPRPREVDGVDYQFLTVEKFEQLIKEDAFIEYEEVHGDYYGTLRSTVESLIANGKKVIFDIDVKGALSIKKKYPDALLIFIKAPSMKELRRRLQARRSESQEAIDKRLKRIDFEYAQADKFDRLVVNNNLEETVGLIENIIRESESELK